MLGKLAGGRSRAGTGEAGPREHVQYSDHLGEQKPGSLKYAWGSGGGRLKSRYLGVLVCGPEEDGGNQLAFFCKGQA